MKKLYFLLTLIITFYFNANSQTTCTAGFRMEAMQNNPLGRHFIAIPGNSQQKKPVEICWKFGDGSPIICKTYPANYTGTYGVEHSYTNAGQYEVCITIKYDGGCEVKKCELIKIEKPNNECEVKLHEAATSVNNLERQFFVEIMPNRKAEKICWYFGDGSSEQCNTIPNPPVSNTFNKVHKYAAPGVYKVCVKVWYEGGCIVEKCKEVVVKPEVTGICGGYITDAVVGPKVFLFKGFAIQNANDRVLTYTWQFGDGKTATGQEVKHEYAERGTYNVCLTIRTASGCETKICKKIVLEEQHPKLVLSPNPVINLLNIKFLSSKSEMVTIKIYNVNGLVVKSYTKNAITGINNWSFSDIGNLPAGAYSVIVQSSFQFANAIFFKQ